MGVLLALDAARTRTRMARLGFRVWGVAQLMPNGDLALLAATCVCHEIEAMNSSLCCARLGSNRRRKALLWHYSVVGSCRRKFET